MRFQRVPKQVVLPGWVLGWALCTVFSLTAAAEHTYVVSVRDEGHHLLHVSGDEVLGSTRIGFGYNYGFSRDRIATLGFDSGEGCEAGCSLLKIFAAGSGRELLSLTFEEAPMRYLSGPRNGVLFADGDEVVYFITLNADPTRPLDLNVVDLASRERLTVNLPRSVGYPSLVPLQGQVGLFDAARSALFAFDVERRELGVALFENRGPGLKAGPRELHLAGQGIFRVEDHRLVDVSPRRFAAIAGKSLAAGSVASASYLESGGVGALAAVDEASRLLTSVLVFSTADSRKISNVEVPFATRQAALSADGRFLIFVDDDQGRLVFYDNRLGAFSYGADLRGRSEGTLTLITRYD